MMRRIDLLPVSYVERRKERRSISLVILVGALLVLALIAWFFLLRSQISTAQDELAAVQAQNLQLEGQIAELQRFADLDAEVKAKKTALQTVFAGDLDWPAILTEIAMVSPGDVWLENLTSSAGSTEGAAPVPSETNAIRLSKKAAVGRISFTAHSASCMPGVAKWLIRLATVDEFEAAWIGSAGEVDTRPGCEPPVDFSSTVELNEKALSRRFEGGLQ